MYQEHPTFSFPADPDVKVWRYMSLGKFISLIHDRALHFARADVLDDPFEGSYTKAAIQDRTRVYAQWLEKQKSDLLDGYSKLGKALLKCHYINSWTQSDHELDAMWKLYVAGHEGVAVQSTARRLRDSLAADDPFIVYIGEVRYLDYDESPQDWGNTFDPYVCKRAIYEAERELRCVFSDTTQFTTGEQLLDDNFNTPLGRKMAVDLGTLIESVYIAPSVGDWFEEIVRSLIAQRGLSFEIRHSRLKDDPSY